MLLSFYQPWRLSVQWQWYFIYNKPRWDNQFSYDTISGFIFKYIILLSASVLKSYNSIVSNASHDIILCTEFFANQRFNYKRSILLSRSRIHTISAAIVFSSFKIIQWVEIVYQCNNRNKSVLERECDD